MSTASTVESASPMQSRTVDVGRTPVNNVWIKPAKGASNLQVSFSYTPNAANYSITRGQTWGGIKTVQDAGNSAQIEVTASRHDGTPPRDFFQDWSYAGGAAPHEFEAVGGGPGTGIPSQFNFSFLGTLNIKNTQTNVTSSYPVVIGQHGSFWSRNVWYLGGGFQTFNFDYGRGILYTTDGLYQITSAHDSIFSSVDTLFVAPAHHS